MDWNRAFSVSEKVGPQDFGLIDLPFPLRKMSVSPVGTLTQRRDRTSGTTRYELSRGVVAFPSVGDQVLMPTPDQVEAIVGAKDTAKCVRIGASPLASNAAILVEPDKLFGRHLAVLGNTGSGKSCTVAGLIPWSIAAANRAIEQSGKDATANARFIVLDPNGEYAKRSPIWATNCDCFAFHQSLKASAHWTYPPGSGAATNGRPWPRHSLAHSVRSSCKGCGN